MAASEVMASTRSRKSATPTTGSSSSRPSSARPTLPKRAHTSTASTATLRNAAKVNVTASQLNNSARARSPLLSPAAASARSRTPHTNAPKTSSPNYFGLSIEDDASNPADSGAGKHAKKNWGSSSSNENGDIPAERDPQFELFRRQSEQQPNHFSLTHSGLSRFSTDGRVPTLKTLKEAQVKNGRKEGTNSSSTLPLSAGGRVQISTGYAEEEDAMDVDESDVHEQSGRENVDANSYFGLPQYESPQPGVVAATPPPTRPEMHRNRLSSVDSTRYRHSHHQSSLPHTRVTTPISTNTTTSPRADTLPSEFSTDGPQFLSANDLQVIINSTKAESVLLLDLRGAPQYAQSRIKGALNLCIPTTLLKRPAFNVQRLAETFTEPNDKQKFSNWQKMSHIVVYDASSIQLKDAQSGINTLKKFCSEGFKGLCSVVKGGFHAVSNSHPELIAKSKSNPAGRGNLKLNLGQQGASGASGGMQVFGGCPMPDSHDKPANPFFGSIRQNMDLMDGVGQMPIKKPDQLNGSNLRGLPTWLRDVVDEEDEGKTSSERFLAIEKAEQARLQKAYTTQVQYEKPAAKKEARGGLDQDNIQISGIEKGTKNRYKDIMPYEHSRVRLLSTEGDDCDYINASHVKAQWSHRRYIAAQAPVPPTFKDFWNMIWEQDVRVIVSLTAEIENGQRKSHPYWNPETYGHYKVKKLSERRISLERPSRASLLDPNRKVSMPLTQMTSSQTQQGRLHRRATLMGEGDAGAGAGAQAAGNGPDASPREPAFCLIRKLAVSDVRQPFVPLREIAQVEYTGWPDLGAPAEPGELLSLVEQVDNVVRASNSAGKGQRNDGSEMGTSPSLPNGLMRIEDDKSKWPAAPYQRPVVVHCSAGCGRSGTFVTVDSVVDMLKRQRLVASRQRNSSRSRPKVDVKVPKGAGAGGDNEPDPFAKSAAAIMSSPTDSIVSPTRRMEIKGGKSSPRSTSGPTNRSGSSSSSSSNDGGSDSSGAEDGSSDDRMEEDEPDLSEQVWVNKDDTDLVEKTVGELRLQRMSMVQNLRQYTLCYESIIEWLVREVPERFRREQFRKSYQG